jgi:hypothetical protein
MHSRLLRVALALMAALVVAAVALAQAPRRAYLPQVVMGPTTTPEFPLGPITIIDVVLRDPIFPESTSEYVQIFNPTGAPVDLAGLRLFNASRPEVPAYVIPAYTLGANRTATVFSGAGRDDLALPDFYWGRPADVWRKGDLAELRDRRGRLIARMIVPAQQ